MSNQNQRETQTPPPAEAQPADPVISASAARPAAPQSDPVAQAALVGATQGAAQAAAKAVVGSEEGTGLIHRAVSGLAAVWGYFFGENQQ
ncbi:hypothetical protein AB0O31_18355 [Kitasatospora cineracea]|uniref:hypothetical protein n=1 Tax=Kitasatospora cineracea TaxID=88074 RepID=UPI00342CCB27